MGRWLLLGIACCSLAACRFNPTLGGQSLVRCAVDGDCPRGGQCVDEVCVSRPLVVASIEASPQVVLAGESCYFVAAAESPARPNRLRYQWQQVLGPRVPLAIDGPRLSLTTTADHVGNYEVEVTARDGVDPPARARASCTALVLENAAFVVAGHSGDCGRLNPCGTLGDTGSATVVYLGVDLAQGEREWNYDEAYLSTTWNGMSLHGGFVFPGWRRDPAAVRTRLGRDDEQIQVRCDDCELSGIYHRFVAGAGTSNQGAVLVDGDNIVLGELELDVSGGGPASQLNGLYVGGAPQNLQLEGIRVVAHDYEGLRLRGLLLSSAAARLRDIEVDLRNTYPDEKVGVVLGEAGGTSSSADRLWVRTGSGEVVTGLMIDCAAPRVWNAVIDTSGPDSGDSTGLHVYNPAGCPSGGEVHSSLLLGGSGQESRAVYLDDFSGGVAIRNSILHAGAGNDRFGIEFDWDVVTPMPLDVAGSVVIFEGGRERRDQWGVTRNGDLSLTELNAAFECVGCLRDAETAAFFDLEDGDFHLTADSNCCRDRGAPLDPAHDPVVDYDGVTRPLQEPSIGPLQFVD